MTPEPRDILAILGAIAGLGGAFAYFRGNQAKATIQLLQDNNKALAEQNTILKSENTELVGKLHHLQGQLDILKDMVTGTSAVQALGEQIAKAFADSRDDHKKMVSVLESISTHFTQTATQTPEATAKTRTAKSN